MHAKKKATDRADIRTEDAKQLPSPRPLGLQTLGPTRYEQIRRALLELDLKLASEN
ncbi:hypothetical protein [Hyalangium rubrum]|uniref:Uncharacterized protein n=1 Tax=Hyalangium rubrum TaxID=3103134 RepID=A0ABU5H605_9BACT|nr:hypothetical protein [Hyalangium sp. s54d21]MDY7228519.1 hypothetical protein [Hyalangium sp. s54d21]